MTILRAAPFPRSGLCCPPLSAARAASRYYEGSHSCRSHPDRQSLPRRRPGPLRLLRLAVPAFRPQPRTLPAGRFVSRLGAANCFQASPWKGRLATAARRIRFVIPGLPLGQALRTAGSPPVAPHLASRRRSYLRLRSLRPAPARTSTVLTKRPRGRTLPGASRDPYVDGPRFARAGSCDGPGRLRSYVRPVCAVGATAGPDGFRGSGPKHPGDVCAPMGPAGCPDPRIDRSPSRCCPCQRQGRPRVRLPPAGDRSRR
jgi:hypothetical protein